FDDLGCLQEQTSSFGRRGLCPGWERFGCGIHGCASLRARSCRNARKKLSAVRLVDLEELFVGRFSPLVTGKIAVLFHVDLCGFHDFTSSASVKRVLSSETYLEHAVRVSRFLWIAYFLQHIPMLDGFTVGVHPVDVDAGNPTVLRGIIK